MVWRGGRDKGGIELWFKICGGGDNGEEVTAGWEGGGGGNREWGDGRRRAFPVLHPFSTVPPLRDPLFTSSITDSVFPSLMYPL